MRKQVLLPLGLALIAAGCVDKPGGFGVNVEVVSSGLDTAVRNQIQTLALHVRGAETFDKASIGDVSSQVRSGAVRFHYVPGVHAGSISFSIDALDAGGAVVASGGAPPVALVDGKAVEVSLRLQAGAHNGVPGASCADDSQCTSAHCADGVCCDTACTGVCESCNQAGLAGTCSPIPENTDPEQECPAVVPPTADTDGGVELDDAGEPILPDGGPLEPDGGDVTIDHTQCAGWCNGQRACAYPTATRACGTAFCSEAAEQAAYVCNGKGTCEQAITSCGDYACGADAQCTTQCVGNDDCAPADFCNASTGKCVPRRPNGQQCTLGYECASGFCISGLCCNTNCDPQVVPGGTCSAPGAEGQCQCTGVTCDSGVGCRYWYKDGDNDGYGDPASKVLGCESGTNGPPTSTDHLVKDNTDCDDANADAHPGQTAFFTTPRANGTFDYDCNNSDDTYYQVVDKNYVSASCILCIAQITLPLGCTQSATCGGTGNPAGLDGKGGGCKGLGKTCAPVKTGNFTKDGKCNAAVSYRTCTACTAAGGASITSIGTQPMPCR